MSPNFGAELTGCFRPTADPRVDLPIDSRHDAAVTIFFLQLREVTTMIGRQFSYYCCPEDLDEIEAKVFRPLGGRVLQIEKKNAAHHITEGHSFSLPLDRMGKESLSLILVPPAAMSNIQWSAPWVDEELSHLIEINRSYINEGIIRSARFWYAPRTYVDRVCVDKPTEYLKWAEAVCRKTKKLLSRHPIDEAPRYVKWFGKVAWQEVSSGRLRATLN